MTREEIIDFCEMKSQLEPENEDIFNYIIKAMETQIPKQPMPIDYEKYMGTVKNAFYLKGAYWCPNCEHVVKCGTYCRNCGQKLDWSEE